MSDKIIPFSRFNRPHTIPCPIGDGTAPVFEEIINKDGKKELIESSRTNLYELVQSGKEECDVYNILNRYARGDIDALNKVAGQFIDVVGMPSNLAEAKQALINVENKFNALPAEVKQLFDNSVDVFASTLSNGKLDEVLSTLSKPANVDVKDGDNVAE